MWEANDPHPTQTHTIHKLQRRPTQNVKKPIRKPITTYTGKSGTSNPAHTGCPRSYWLWLRVAGTGGRAVDCAGETRSIAVGCLKAVFRVTAGLARTNSNGACP